MWFEQSYKEIFTACLGHSPALAEACELLELRLERDEERKEPTCHA